MSSIRESSLHRAAIRAEIERSEEKSGRSARGRKERKKSVRPIVVREFARQEHYREKMFRDCALERDVFGSLVYVSPGLPPPEDCPVSSLSTTLSCDRYPVAFSATSLAVLVFPFFLLSVSIETVVCRSYEERKSA